MIISYKRIVSRAIPKKPAAQGVGLGKGRRAAAEEQLLFIAAGDKRKEKSFTNRKTPWT